MKKVICSILAVVMALTVFMSQSFAKERNDVNNKLIIPSFMESEELQASGIVKNLNEYDDDKNVVGFLNNDGSKTVYIYGTDVKYIDENGKLQYKDISSINIETLTDDYSSNATINASCITDATVYSNQASTTHGTGIENAIGSNSTLGTARTYVKFDLSSISGVRYDNIISAYYRVKELSNTYSYSVAEAYFVKSYWTETTLTWNNKPDYYQNEKICNVNINNNTTYGDPKEFYDDFYITSAVQAWQQGVMNYGIMLKEKDDNVWKKLSSDENTTYPPCLVVTYLCENETSEAIGLDNSSYYIVNKNSSKYITANSLIAGDSIKQYSGSSSVLKVWTLNHLDNGYYSIKIGNTDACLEVANGAITNGVAIQVGLYTGASKQQWKIVRNWDGSYRVIARSSGTKGLYVQGASADNGVNIIQYFHSNDFNKADDWTFLPVEKGTASLFCFNEAASGIDTTTNIDNMSWFIQNQGYTSTVRLNSNATTGIQQLQNDAIWLYTGHGNYSALAFWDSNRNNTWIATQDCGTGSYVINNLNSNLFCNNLLSILASCCTGGNALSWDGTNADQKLNFTGIMYKKGCHNIISYTRVTTVGPDSDWLTNFILGIAVGRDIYTAKERADEALYDDYSGFYGNMNNRHDLGDQSIQITYNEYINTQTVSAAENSQLLTLDSSVSINNSSDESKFACKQVKINNERQSLNKIMSINEDALGYAYDVYSDDNNGIYKLYKGTNTISSYEPDLSSLYLGDTIVNTEDALNISQNFLENLGYKTDDFVCTHSNGYSKDYKIEYRYCINGTPTSEKIVFHIKSDGSGKSFITSFKATDYGDFSNNTKLSIDIDNMYSELNNKLSSDEYIEEKTQIDSSYLWRNEDGNICLRTLLSVEGEDGIPVMEIVDIL